MASKIFEIAFELGGRVSPEMRAAFTEAQDRLNCFEDGAGSANKAMRAMKGGALVAGAAIAGITTALAGAVVQTSEFSSSMAQLQAATGASKKEIAEMKGIMTNLYNDNLGEDWEDLSDAISTTQNVTGLAGEELQKATANALVYRDVFGEEINESIKATDTMMKNFGITADQSYNLLAQGAQNGLNKSDELIDSANEYAPYFSALGFSADSMFDVFSDGLANGAFNLDKVGDAVKEFNIRAKDGSKSSAEAFKALGFDANKMTQTFAKGGIGAQEAFTKVTQAIGKVKDPAEQSAIAVSLFGTQAEDLEMGVITSLGHVESKFDMTKKTMQSVKDIKYDTLGAAFQGIGRQIATGVLIPIGDKLLPYLSMFSNWVKSNLPIITSNFSKGFSVIKDVVVKAFSNINLGAITDIFSKLGSTIQNVFANFDFGTYFSAFQKYFGVIKSMIGGVVTVIQSLIPVVQPIISKIVNLVMSVISQVMTFWNSEGAQIIQAVQNVFGGIAAIFRFISPAILFIVNMVWQNVRGVIQGALNIILGAIKIFSGLFTGDFGKMWEGVKQLFSGAIKFLWNLVNLMFYGKILGGIRALASSGIGVVRGMWGSIKNFFTTGVETAWSKVNALGPKLKQGFVIAKENAVNVAQSMWQGISKWFSKIVEGARSLPGKIGSGIKSMAGKAVDGVKSMGNSMLKNIGDMVNGVIKGINWVTDKLGVDSKLSLWPVPQYARGTNSHPGGPAILGDGGGPELYRTPNGQVGLSPGTDTIMNLPAGTQVIPAMQTAQILQQYNVPAYAKGTGVMEPVKKGLSWIGDKAKGAAGFVSDKASDIWDVVSDPSALFERIASKFNVAASGKGSALNIATGALSKIKETAIGYLKDKTSEFLSANVDISGGASAWAGKIKQAAGQMQVDLSSGELRGIIAQIHRESGGNQKIIQSSAVVDVNTLSGNPAKGLLQYIPSTFNAYKLNGFNDIFNGYHQLLAFFNNSNWRSDLPYGKSGWGPSGSRRFAKGGTVTGDSPILAHEKGAELIDTPAGSRVTTAANSKQWLKRLVEFGQSDKNSTSNTSSNAKKYEINVSPVFHLNGTEDTATLKQLLANASNDIKNLVLQALKEIEGDKAAVTFGGD